MFINPTLFGANITDTQKPVTYRCSIFSLSSSIKDDTGTVLAEQTRTSWWTLKFDVVTSKGKYQFYQKYFDYFLEHESGAILRTHNSTDFYSSNMQQVTNLQHSNKLGKKWELDLLTEHHRSALVIASVTMCKLNPMV